jgi:hypothetical protein
MISSMICPLARCRATLFVEDQQHSVSPRVIRRRQISLSCCYRISVHLLCRFITLSLFPRDSCRIRVAYFIVYRIASMCTPPEWVKQSKIQNDVRLRTVWQIALLFVITLSNDDSCHVQILCAGSTNFPLCLPALWSGSCYVPHIIECRPKENIHTSGI